MLQTNEGQDLHHVTLSAGHVGNSERGAQRTVVLRGFISILNTTSASLVLTEQNREEKSGFLWERGSSSYLPAVKQLPFAAPNVEKATKRNDP